MPDFPGQLVTYPKFQINPLGPASALYDGMVIASGIASTGGTWPVANKALFIPFQVEKPCVAQKMGVIVVTQAGNYDVGIYDEKGNKLVSLGSTAVPAAGLAVADIADTTLNPGTYWMAMACSSATASFNRQNSAQLLQRLGGVQEMSTAMALPATITFTNPATNYFPLLFIQCGSVL